MERPGRQHLAEARDIGLNGFRGVRGGLVAPQSVDESVDGHRAVGLEQQHGEERALLLGPEVEHRAAVVERLEGPEDPELHIGPKLTPGLASVSPARSDEAGRLPG